MTDGLSRWLHTLPTPHSVITSDVISKPRQVLTCSCRGGWHGWNASEGVPHLVLIETTWMYNCSFCAQGQESAPVVRIYIFNYLDKCVMSCFSPSSLLCLENSTERRGFTFHNCLLPVSVSYRFERPQTLPVWIKAINNLLHVLHSSLITVTPFLSSLRLHCSRGFLSSLP